MATRLLGRVKAKVIETGSELGARVASRALDAAEAMDRVRLNVERIRHDAPERLLAAARKVPVVGKRVDDAPQALRAAASRVPFVARRLKPAAAPKQEAAASPKVSRRTAPPPSAPSKVEFRPPGPGEEYFTGRKVITSRGRKTVPAAAAKRVRAKSAPQPFKAKRGQKKKHH